MDVNMWQDRMKGLHHRLEVGLDEEVAWEVDHREAHPNIIGDIRIWEGIFEYVGNHRI